MHDRREARILPGSLDTLIGECHEDRHPSRVCPDTRPLFLRSTLASKESVKWEDGNEYPLVKVDISSASHPFYTGKSKVLDAGGRVDKFRKRYAQKAPDAA